MLLNVLGLAVAFTVGFFVARANGDGTKLDSIADKIDAKWDESVKPLLDKLEAEIKKIESKTKK